MRSRLRFFVLVGVIATTVDIALAVVAADWIGVVWADVVALTVASNLSYLLNRTVTFQGDPTARWVSQPLTFFTIAVVAGLVDLGLVVLGQWLGLALVGAKLAGVMVAGGLRWTAYRRVLLGVVRRELSQRVERPPVDRPLALSVVLPAYNESQFIGDSVTQVIAELSSQWSRHQFEVIVADDGSSDDTATRARQAGARVIQLEENQGKGAAVRAGIMAAKGRAVVFTDADLAYPPELVARLVREIEQGWDVVVGSRRHGETRVAVRGRFIRQLGGRAINLLTRVVLLGSFRDTQCGLKGFRGDIAQILFERTRLDGFAFDVEIFLLAEQDRLSVLEVPVSVSNRSGSSVRLVRDTMGLLVDLLRIRRWVGEGTYQATPEQQLVLDARA